ncbi:MAG: CotH kinase family protein [Clostridiales bacterium]|jgi:spore coat protein CotH|nr:CotH kinase family protein [Clostridiales bacterium]
MSKSKYTNLICIVVIIVMLIGTVGIIGAACSGAIPVMSTAQEYESTLFATDTVHAIDIQMADSDWNAMLENALAEEYYEANIVIDGETLYGVGIRPKGNTSLTQVANSDSDRFSFKVEFDQYVGGQNYKGLDKLVLNNLVQDNTYMKDYTTYQMMRAAGVDAPLCSFANITLNGEVWGLYLAVEAVETSFAERNYGSNFGEIYKPDSMGLNQMGDDGNMKMPDWNNQNSEQAEAATGEQNAQMPQRGERPQMPNGGNFGGAPPDMSGMPSGEMPDMSNMPDMSQMPNGEMPNMGERPMGGFGGFGGNEAVALQYIDDDSDSYDAIFESSVFGTDNGDKTRLIKSLKQLSSGENLESIVDTDEVMRYFTVHNFVQNDDSYTGSLLHNYYLYEENGQLSMIPWDYNLAYGAMGGMGGNRGGESGGNSATSVVNAAIDYDETTTETRPMLAWIFNNSDYKTTYHELYSEFITNYFDSGEFAKMYDNAISLISTYVEADPTKFCTYEQFQTGAAGLRQICLARAESVKAQLAGNATPNIEVDVDLSSLGSMNALGGMGRGGFEERRQNENNAETPITQ